MSHVNLELSDKKVANGTRHKNIQDGAGNVTEGGVVVGGVSSASGSQGGGWTVRDDAVC